MDCAELIEDNPQQLVAGDHAQSSRPNQSSDLTDAGETPPSERA